MTPIDSTCSWETLIRCLHILAKAGLLEGVLKQAEELERLDRMLEQINDEGIGPNPEEI